MNDTTSITGRVLMAPTSRGFALVVGHRRIAVRFGVPGIDAALPEAGDVVRVDGTVEPDGAVLASAVTAVVPYRGPRPFPPVRTDWYRLQKNGARLFRSIEQRATLNRALRGWFEESGFLEVDTPAIATSPGLEVHLDAVPVDVKPGFGAAPEQRWLVTSPEYFMKRLLACGFERIYQISKAFRSGEVSRLHNPEFAMLEWYRAPGGWEDIVSDTEALVVRAARALGVGSTIAAGEHVIDLEPPWPRMTVRDAIRTWGGFDPWPWDDVAALRARAMASGLDGIEDEQDPAEILVRAMVERVEPSLPPHRPLVLCHYPWFMASLARRTEDDPGVSERFEIYVAGVELANGFGELTDPAEQRRRFEADQEERRRRGLPVYPIDERFLAALAVGCPPAGGIALGVDRLLMILTGASDIADVVAFVSSEA